MENGGVGYGSSEIINLDRQPQVTIESGSDAQLKPVNNGRIVNVLVQNPGSRYISVPDLDVNGDGQGAVLVPVIRKWIYNIGDCCGKGWWIQSVFDYD